MIRKYLFFSFLLLSVITQGQQDSQYTQYMYNTLNVNPAYAGSRGVMSIFGLHRNQWVGLEGAPVTNTLALHTPINRSNMGIGLSFVNDRIGPVTENIISIDASYTVKASTNSKLSFGIKGVANLFNINFDVLNKYNQDNLSQNLSKFSPNVGAGIYWHTAKTYFGFSVPNFLETKRFEEKENIASVAKERMHYHFIGGHVFELSPSLKFKPAFLTKLVQGAPLQVDLSGNFLINEKFVLGAAYRWSAAASFLAGVQFNKNWFLGYAYDLETTRLRAYNSGSHEIFLRYEFTKKIDNIVSPRFF